MKKFLSLVLALVMTMSLVTISAGAKDFTDSSKVTYTEAVDVLSAVKVIDGYTDGAFKPTTQLNRGQAAKILCNMILGPTTASALKADAAPFKDVPVDNTFAAYIAYCAKEGIIDGYTDGTFKPSAPLTGYAFMKLLLGALGYDKDVEGYNAPNWSINVAKQALALGLDDGLVSDFDGTKIVTREEACLYALNTMKADMVEYDAKTSISVGGAEVVIAGSKAKAVEYKDGKNDGGIGVADGILQFAEKYFADLDLDDWAEDDFDRPSNMWKLKSKEIGTYPRTADATYTKQVKVADIYKDLGLGKTLDSEAVFVSVNGVYDKDLAVDLKKADTDNKFGGNGVLTQVYYNDKYDFVTITLVHTYVGEVTRSVAAKGAADAYVEFTADSKPDSVSSAAMKYETEEKFEDDAFVLYTYSEKTEAVKSLVVAEEVNGIATKTINKVTDTDQNNGITLGDTAYKMSKNNAGDTLGSVSINNEYTIYLDSYGYAIYIKEIEEIGDYALVLATANKSDFVGKKAELLFTDGTTKVVNTAKDYSTGSNLIADNTIVTYKEDDGVYTLKAVTKNGGTQSTTGRSTDFKLTNDKATVFVESGSPDVVATANSKSTFVVANPGSTDDYTAYTGIKSAPTVAAGINAREGVSAYWYAKTGKMITVMFVFPEAKVKVEDDNSQYLFLANGSVSDLQHVKNGDYFEYNAIVGGEITTVKVDEATKYSTTKAEKLNGLFASFSTDKYDVITKVNGYTYTFDGNYPTDGFYKSYLTGAGIDKKSADYTVILDTVNNSTDPAYTITVADDAKIFYVDDDDKISEINYNAIAKDTNDKVYAIVQDYLVKILVIEDVDDKQAVTPDISTEDYLVEINGTSVDDVLWYNDPDVTGEDDEDTILDVIMAALIDKGYTEFGTITESPSGTYNIPATKGNIQKTFTWVTSNLHEAVRISIDGTDILADKTAKVSAAATAADVDLETKYIIETDKNGVEKKINNATTLTVADGSSYESGYVKVTKDGSTTSQLTIATKQVDFTYALVADSYKVDNNGLKYIKGDTVEIEVLAKGNSDDVTLDKNVVATVTATNATPETYDVATVILEKDDTATDDPGIKTYMDVKLDIDDGADTVALTITLNQVAVP